MCVWVRCGTNVAAGAKIYQPILDMRPSIKYGAVAAVLLVIVLLVSVAFPVLYHTFLLAPELDLWALAAGWRKSKFLISLVETKMRFCLLKIN